MKDIDIIHFQSREHKVMFRHRQIAGRTEYTMENYQGEVLTTEISPKVNFEVWVIRKIEELLGQYGIVGAMKGTK